MPSPGSAPHWLEATPVLQLGSGRLGQASVAQLQLPTAWFCGHKQSPFPLTCHQNYLACIRPESGGWGEAASAQKQLEAAWPKHSSLLPGVSVVMGAKTGKTLQLQGLETQWLCRLELVCGPYVADPCITASFCPEVALVFE